jgi:protein transport protein SEC24
LARETAVPLAIIVKPFGELPNGEPTPCANFNNKPIVRCRECRAYINPFVKFVELGQKWICNFCKDVNQVESYYYSSADA